MISINPRKQNKVKAPRSIRYLGATISILRSAPPPPPSKKPPLMTLPGGVGIREVYLCCHLVLYVWLEYGEVYVVER